MLSFEILDRLRDPIGHAVEMRTPLLGAFDLGEEVERDLPAPKVDRILSALAYHRTGQDEIDGAFREDELQRLRRFLVFAGEARSRVIRTRRRKAERLIVIDDMVDVVADTMAPLPSGSRRAAA